MAETFDDLTKILGSHLSRRQAFRLFAGGVAGRYLTPLLAGGAFSFLWPDRASAAGALPVVVCNGQYCVGPGGIGGGLCNKDCSANLVCCPANFNLCTACGCCAATEVCCGNKNPGYCCPQGMNCCPLGDGCCLPPGFRLAAYYTYPRNTIEVEVREYSGVGLASVGVAQAVNAEVDIPYFASGSPSVMVTASRIDQSQPARLVLKACSLGCQSQCCETGDPVVTQLQTAEGRERVAESFSDIPAADHFVTVQNGRRGLNRFQVLVNGERAANVVLRRGEVRTVDIAAAMRLTRNVVTVIGHGASGSSALVVLSDVEDTSGAKASTRLPVVWEEHEWDPGVNLHWGN